MSVSIIAETGIVADAYSTIAFALGLVQGLELIEANPSLEAVFVTEDLDIYATSGVRELISITNQRYTLVNPET